MQQLNVKNKLKVKVKKLKENFGKKFVQKKTFFFRLAQGGTITLAHGMALGE